MSPIRCPPLSIPSMPVRRRRFTIDGAGEPEYVSAMERYVGSRNPLTPHAADRYEGLLVVDVAPGWPYNVIVPTDGQTIVGLGGERVYGYTTPAGVEAQGFTLGPGDRATRVRSDLPAHLCEWRVE